MNSNVNFSFNSASALNTSRLVFVDQFRGLIMVLMALDHALYFWSSGRFSNEGLPLLVNGMLQFNKPGGFSFFGYLVMLLSSIAAPGFSFIAGYVLSQSVKRRMQKGMTSSDMTKHLFKRGVILILLQFFIISPAFNLPLFIQAKSTSVFSLGTFLSFSTLSTIGIGFIYLAIMRRFSPWVVFLSAVGLYAGSQWFLPTLVQLFPQASLLEKAIINLLVLPVPFSPHYLLNNNFPVIPWLVPLTFGWLFGQTYNAQRDIQYEGKRFFRFGLFFLISFFILRFNHLGDALTFNGSISSLFILSKYPPSLDYFLFYMGVMFMLLTSFIQLKSLSKSVSILEEFGRAPLFFYNTHLWIYGLIPFMLQKFNVLSAGEGIIIWFLGLLVFYPLGRWYLNGRIKENRHIILPHTN